MKKHILLACLLFLMFSVSASALERFEIVTTTEMVQLLKDRENSSIDFLLVNSLDTMIYNHSSIPGSIHVPLGQFKEYADRLGQDTGKLIIPY